MHSSHWKTIVVTAIIAVLCAIFTLPLLMQIGSGLVGDGGDNYLNIIYQHIVAKRLSSFQYPFSHDNTLRYPVGYDFSRGYDMFLFALVGGILMLFLNYAVAFNTTWLLSLLLNGLCSFFLFKEISKSRIIGLIGSVFYGFSFYTLSRGAGHFGHATTAGFPLLIFALIKLRNNPSLFNFMMVSIATLLIILAFLQNILMLLVLCLVAIPLLTILFPRIVLDYVLILKRYPVRLIVAALFFFTVFFITCFPFISAMMSGSFADGNRALLAKENSILIKEFVFPNPFSQTLSAYLFNSGTKKSIENVVFIGWVELILFFLFFFTGVRKRIKLLIGTLFFIFVILSMGGKSQEFDVFLPYHYLSRFFPFYYIPESGRFVLIFSLFSSIASILTITYLFRKNKAILVLILTMGILERLPYPTYYIASNQDRPYTKIVREQQSNAVLDIPISTGNSVYDTLAIHYDKPIVSGYFVWSADTKESRSFVDRKELKRFQCDGNTDPSAPKPTEADKYVVDQRNLNTEMIKLLKQWGINTIVVHQNDPIDHAKYFFPECANVRMQTSILFPQLFQPEATLDNKQKVMSIFFPSVLQYGDSIQFPASGIFQIDGFHVYPQVNTPITVVYEDHIIPFQQEWKAKDGNNAVLDTNIRIDATAGARLRFQFSKNNNESYSFIKAWYRYFPVQSTQSSGITASSLKKIYQDEDAVIFTLE